MSVTSMSNDEIRSQYEKVSGKPWPAIARPIPA